jgi:hypothetical protein
LLPNAKQVLATFFGKGPDKNILGFVSNTVSAASAQLFRAKAVRDNM